MRAHLSEQEKLLVLENRTIAVPSEVMKHLHECPQCKAEIKEQREMDNILLKLAPQKIDVLVSKNIIARLQKNMSPMTFNPVWIAAALIIFLSVLFIGFQTDPGTESIGFSYDKISEKSVQWAQRAVDAPATFWKAINWTQLKQTASWIFQPDSTRIFFVLIIFGFYALIDLHIRRHFYH